MTIEIELKFLVNPETIPSIKSRITAWQHCSIEPQLLTNRYFETPDQTLRSWDMGLRIRGIGNTYEMTLKTAGKEIGGLNQRPEYNISLTEPKLLLSALPSEVWPEDCDLRQLESSLQALFSTDFTREKWLVTVGESIIEVALDQGTINADTQQLPLCELELELISGEREDLFKLANNLINEPGLRLGNQSKAARGYRLAKGQTSCAPAASLYPRLQTQLTVEQGLEKLLARLLNRWQQCEELWLLGDKMAVYDLQQTLIAIREIFALFGGIVPRQSSSQLRHQLQEIEAQLAEDSASEICYSPLSVGAQLALVTLLVERQWRQASTSRQQVKLQGSFKRFCDVMLSRTAAELKDWARQDLTLQELKQSEPRLTKLTLAIPLLSAAYSEQVMLDWLAPWQQIQTQLSQQQWASVNSQRAILTKVKPFWLASDHR